jgi:uncharacterized protein (TIGR02444 family)
MQTPRLAERILPPNGDSLIMSDDSTPIPEALRTRLAADPLWDFALALYARPGVEAACLALQDGAGVDVCELLWHCWLYRHGLALGEEPAELVSIRQWQQAVTTPLRTLRRRLTAEAQHRAGVAEVRRQLQRTELAAERETLDRLQRLAEHGHGLYGLPRPSPSLQSVLASRWQLPKKPQFLALQTLAGQLDPP